MRVVIAGGHGKIALILERLLAERGDTVTGIIRNPAQAADLEAAGAAPAVLDLEQASVDQVAEVVRGADAVGFAAGAGPGSGAARKQTVDRDAAVLLADAAEAAGGAGDGMGSAISAEERRLAVGQYGVVRADPPGKARAGRDGRGPPGSAWQAVWARAPTA